MSDLAISSFHTMSRLRWERATTISASRLRWLQPVIVALVAVTLTVPESEIRAKGFKMGIVLQNFVKQRKAVSSI